MVFRISESITLVPDPDGMLVISVKGHTFNHQDLTAGALVAGWGSQPERTADEVEAALCFVNGRPLRKKPAPLISGWKGILAAGWPLLVRD